MKASTYESCSHPGREKTHDNVAISDPFVCHWPGQVWGESIFFLSSFPDDSVNVLFYCFVLRLWVAMPFPILYHLSIDHGLEFGRGRPCVVSRVPRQGSPVNAEAYKCVIHTKETESHRVGKFHGRHAVSVVPAFPHDFFSCRGEVLKRPPSSSNVVHCVTAWCREEAQVTLYAAESVGWHPAMRATNPLHQ